MPLELIGAVILLLAWIVVTFIIPLGPAGSPLHLLLGISAALFVRWWALRDGTSRPSA